MWVPSSAHEIEDAARSGDLRETSSFDAKADLPQPMKNSEVAKDVAAMATNGGVLLYGVAEDEHGNPSEPQPISLAGAPERVSQIVSTSIAEVPFIDVRAFPCEEDPSKGYLVVIVPQSARAPHMVIVGGDNRYYGRDAKGNRILTEADVARLYERRQRWEVDREQVLRDVIAHPPAPPREGQGYVYAYTRPTVLDQSILEHAQEKTGAPGPGGPMVQWLLNVVHSTVLRGRYGPSLEQSPYLYRFGGDMWRWANRTRESITEEDFDPGNLVVIDFNIDGRGQMFCGRATDALLGKPEQRYVIEVVIAGSVEAFFAVMGALYEAADYHGSVDVGLALTGVRGAESERLRGFLHHEPHAYPVDIYTRTARVAAAELRASAKLGHQLLRHFFEATTGIDGYNPWTEPESG
jgi:hypothetical protein